MFILASFGAISCLKEINVDSREGYITVLNERVMLVSIPKDKVIFDEEYGISFGFFTKMFILFSDSIVFKGFTLRENKNIFNLPINVYKNFPNLILYDGSKSSLSNIKYKHFEMLKYLQIIALNENQISYIQSSAFKDLCYLKNLYLHENQLTSIDGMIFNRLNNLEELFLHSNKISYVSDIAFDSLTELKNLTLYGNDNKVWKDEFFKNNKKLRW